MSDPNRLLGHLIAVAPLNYIQGDYGNNTLKVVLPMFRYKDIRSYHYLSKRKQFCFVSYIHGWFKVYFHSEMNKYISMGYNRKECIYLFMDNYDMPESSFDALLKDYSRYMVNKSKYGEKEVRNVINYPTLLIENDPEEMLETEETVETLETLEMKETLETEETLETKETI